MQVICATAFGERADWNANVVPEGHTLTFPDALSGALDGLLAKFVTPKVRSLDTQFYRGYILTRFSLQSGSSNVWAKPNAATMN